MLLTEGLEMQLLQLEGSSDDFACTICLEPESKCTCGTNQLWPISQVITLIKLELSLRDKDD